MSLFHSGLKLLFMTVRLKNNPLHTSFYKNPTIPKPIYALLGPTPHTFASIVYRQVLRYKRICSDAKELNLLLTTLKNAFVALGYKPKIVKNQITKARSISREALLKYQTKSESDCISLVLTYHPYLGPIKKIDKTL